MFLHDFCCAFCHAFFITHVLCSFRNPMFLPHPPSSLSEPYRSPFEERSQIYESRNLLDPNQTPCKCRLLLVLRSKHPSCKLYRPTFIILTLSNLFSDAHHNVPGSGFPVSYWDVPSGRSVPSQLGNHSPHSQHSASSFPEPHLQWVSPLLEKKKCLYTNIFVLVSVNLIQQQVDSIMVSNFYRQLLCVFLRRNYFFVS